jgi:hypothetical protein
MIHINFARNAHSLATLCRLTCLLFTHSYYYSCWTPWYPRSRSRVTTDGQSVSMSRYLAHSGTCDQILLSVLRLLSESCCLVSVGHPLWQEVGSVICHSQCIVIYQYLHQAFMLHVLQFSNLYTIYTKLLSVPSRYSRLCSTSYYELKLPQ